MTDKNSDGSSNKGHHVATRAPAASIPQKLEKNSQTSKRMKTNGHLVLPVSKYSKTSKAMKQDRISTKIKAESVTPSSTPVIGSQEVSSAPSEPHVQYVNGKERYRCDHPKCEDTFTSKFSWRRHRKKHTGERPWGCVYCLRYFGEKSTLQKHLHTHKEFRKHKELVPWLSMAALNAKHGTDGWLSFTHLSKTICDLPASADAASILALLGATSAGEPSAATKAALQAMPNGVAPHPHAPPDNLLPFGRNPFSVPMSQLFPPFSVGGHGRKTDMSFVATATRSFSAPSSSPATSARTVVASEVFDSSTLLGSVMRARDVPLTTSDCWYVQEQATAAESSSPATASPSNTASAPNSFPSSPPNSFPSSPNSRPCSPRPTSQPASSSAFLSLANSPVKADTLPAQVKQEEKLPPSTAFSLASPAKTPSLSYTSDTQISPSLRSMSFISSSYSSSSFPMPNHSSFLTSPALVPRSPASSLPLASPPLDPCSSPAFDGGRPFDIGGFLQSPYPSSFLPSPDLWSQQGGMAGMKTESDGARSPKEAGAPLEQTPSLLPFMIPPSAAAFSLNSQDMAQSARLPSDLPPHLSLFPPDAGTTHYSSETISHSLSDAIFGPDM
eukprot:g68314.t1